MGGGRKTYGFEEDQGNEGDVFVSSRSTHGPDVLRLHWIWCHQFSKTRKAAQKAANAAEAKTLTLAQKKRIVAAAKKRWAAERRSKARR